MTTTLKYVNAMLSIALISGCGKANKNQILFGQATSLSGPYASGTKVIGNPVYEMWIEEVNAEGGIYVEEFGKKLPIKLIQYDDESDDKTMSALLEKLIVEDKVDFLLPPFGTNLLFTAAPIANQHGHIMLSGPGGAIKLKEIISSLPYLFVTLNSADTQMPVLADIVAASGVKKAAIVFIQDLHGIEYSQVASTELTLRGIDVVMFKSFPLETKDFSAIFDQAQQNNVEAFLAFTYPDETFAMAGQASAVGFSPKLFYTSVGTMLPAFRDAFRGAEGVMGPGGWSPKASAGAKDFRDKYVARYNEEPDYWGGLWYYASMQFLRQAIERVGSLNRSKIRDVMATATFDTSMGPMHFVGGFNANHPGEISQWQNGAYEIIGPADKKTADPIYPKPAWH